MLLSINDANSSVYRVPGTELLLPEACNKTSDDAAELVDLFESRLEGLVQKVLPVPSNDQLGLNFCQ
jgi:hypothetical protein